MTVTLEVPHAFREKLSTATVDAIPTPKGEVVVVYSDEQPVTGFQKLLDHKILSAPVFDRATHKYTGFLDIRDLVSFCVFVNDNHDSSNPAENLLDIVNYGSKMFKHAVDGVTVTYLSRRNPFHPVKKGSKLQDVVDVLARGIRRVPVVGEDGLVVNIISQSSIVQFMQHHIGDLKEIASRTVKELGIGSSPVLAVSKEDKAVDVFRMMELHSRSGVAVLDSRGVLVGNTSGRDLQLFIKTPSLALLQVHIVDFLNRIRNMEVDISVPVISCSESDSFGMVVGKLAATRVHRVFITDSEYRPVKVVSITDVLRAIGGGK